MLVILGRWICVITVTPAVWEREGEVSGNVLNECVLFMCVLDILTNRSSWPALKSVHYARTLIFRPTVPSSGMTCSSCHVVVVICSLSPYAKVCIKRCFMSHFLKGRAIWREGPSDGHCNWNMSFLSLIVTKTYYSFFSLSPGYCGRSDVIVARTTRLRSKFAGWDMLLVGVVVLLCLGCFESLSI